MVTSAPCVCMYVTREIIYSIVLIAEFKNDNGERRINHGTVLRKTTRLIARIGSDFVDRDHTYVRVFNDAPYQDFEIT